MVSRVGRSPLLLPLLLAAALSAGVSQVFLTAPWALSSRRASGRASRVALAVTLEERYRMGTQALHSGSDLALGVQTILEAAGDGYAPAQMSIGVIYAEGLFGVPVDLGKAQKWLEKACQAGSLEAHFNLGVFQLTGKNGFPVDKREAARHFKVAGEGGHEDAQTNLAMMFIRGDGIPRDASEGAQWLVKVAQKEGRLEQLMKKIADGELDPQTSQVLADQIERLRDVYKQAPDQNPASTGVVENYPRGN